MPVSVGVIALADGIKNSGALAVLNMEDNGIELTTPLCRQLANAISLSPTLCVLISEGNSTAQVDRTMPFEILQLVDKPVVQCLNVRSKGLTGIYICM